ncbi:MAG: histidinol dehydrogenase [Deltaproteobacteria bacterium]|nr:histidinol dehydrogenase [Deltaproteobacteria bacterium]
MKIIRTGDTVFEETFRRIRQRGKLFDTVLWAVVRGIVDDVAARGDRALFHYTEKFDGVVLNAASVEVSLQEQEDAIAQVGRDDLEILGLAARRIESFHRQQLREDWSISDDEGIELGQRVTPLERIGIYAPGGLAAYPSTVLMAAIPAKIAGVDEIILVSPNREGGVKPLIAAAARLGGVKRIFKIGGAQAVAALAFGTGSVPRVDKIVGPGNAYVAAAKKMVYGQVAIDMIAGPSEVVVIADGKADAASVAADLLAQAEHDAMASAVLVTPDETLALQVVSEVERQLKLLPKKTIAVRSLEDFGALFITKDISEAVAIANRFAPEHLELMVENPQEILKRIRNAGAVFLGYSTPEAIGDYIAGPNHILPTGGTARFSSPLGVYDFVKRTSVLSFSPDSLRKYGRQAERFARMEGLDGHGESIAVRLARNKP